MQSIFKRSIWCSTFVARRGCVSCSHISSIRTKPVIRCWFWRFCTTKIGIVSEVRTKIVAFTFITFYVASWVVLHGSDMRGIVANMRPLCGTFWTRLSHDTYVAHVLAFILTFFQEIEISEHSSDVVSLGVDTILRKTASNSPVSCHLL